MVEASGIGSYLRALAPVMADISRETKFVFLAGQNPGCHHLDISGENGSFLYCRAPIYTFREQIELPLRIPRSDIFWSPHYNVPVFPIRARRRLVTIHDAFHLAYFSSLPLPQKIYAKTLMNAAVRLSDKVITVSEFSKREIVKYTKVSEEKITVIYNGINRDLFHIMEDTAVSAGVKEKYGLPKRFILFVGNVKPHKNIKGLLLASERLLMEGLDDFGIVIVGKKEGFIRCDEEVFGLLEGNERLKKRAVFTGYVENEDLPVLYNLASLFVFPSLYEGFGFPPLEAMACGCPVVVSNVASLPEVCGDAAYYVDPYDVESIAEGMLKVLTDDSLRQRLKKKGLERIRLFDWAKSAKDHMMILRSLL
jgi:glycosyltransferase involved in cell wall biosynthesis